MLNESHDNGGNHHEDADKEEEHEEPLSLVTDEWIKSCTLTVVGVILCNITCFTLQR